MVEFKWQNDFHDINMATISANHPTKQPTDNGKRRKWWEIVMYFLSTERSDASAQFSLSRDQYRIDNANLASGDIISSELCRFWIEFLDMPIFLKIVLVESFIHSVNGLYELTGNETAVLSSSAYALFDFFHISIFLWFLKSKLWNVPLGIWSDYA